MKRHGPEMSWLECRFGGSASPGRVAGRIPLPSHPRPRRNAKRPEQSSHPRHRNGAPHVAIIGGGPAGAATAIAVRGHLPNCRISLIEASDYDASRIGETLHPAARILLRRLGVWDGFVMEDHAEAHGSVAAWGSDEPLGNDFFTARFGSGFHLDRRRFDAWLAAQAERRGITLWRGTRLEDARDTAGGWRLRLARDTDRFDLAADFVVDAGGRRARFARLAGARPVRYDRLIGAYLFFENTRSGSFDSRTRIESAPYGWWYGAPLPGHRIAVACMTDHDIARRLGLARRDAWLDALAETRHLRPWLGSAAPDGEPVLCAAQASRLDRCIGERWLAVGDAAAHFDPLSGQGLVQALRGGIAAAFAIADAFAGRKGALARYQAVIDAEVNAFLPARDHFYGLERRWPREEFWRRRQVPIVVPPGLRLQAAEKAVPSPSRSNFHLSSNQWQRLLTLCRDPQPAHAVVARLRNETGLPARHLVLALQKALETGELMPV